MFNPDHEKRVEYLESLVRRLMANHVYDVDDYSVCRCCGQTSEDWDNLPEGHDWHADDCPWQEAQEWFWAKGEGVN